MTTDLFIALCSPVGGLGARMAILTEPTGTTVVEHGWPAERAAADNLILRRIVAVHRQKAIRTKVGPVMLELCNTLFMSFDDQMGATPANTAYAVNMKNRYDVSCAIFDEACDLVATAPHFFDHLGSMPESVRTIQHQNTGKIRPGDVVIMNIRITKRSAAPRVSATGLTAPKLKQAQR